MKTEPEIIKSDGDHYCCISQLYTNSLKNECEGDPLVLDQCSMCKGFSKKPLVKQGIYVIRPCFEEIYGVNTYEAFQVTKFLGIRFHAEVPGTSSFSYEKCEERLFNIKGQENIELIKENK